MAAVAVRGYTLDSGVPTLSWDATMEVTHLPSMVLTHTTWWQVGWSQDSHSWHDTSKEILPPRVPEPSDGIKRHQTLLLVYHLVTLSGDFRHL